MKKLCCFLSVFYFFTLSSMNMHTMPPEIITDCIVPYLATIRSSSEEQALSTFTYLSFIFQNELTDIKNVLNLSITSPYLYNLLKNYRITTVSAKDLLAYVQKENTKQFISIFNYLVDYKKSIFPDEKIQKKPLIKYMSVNINLSKNAAYIQLLFPNRNEDRKNDPICIFELLVKTSKHILDHKNENSYKEIVNCTKLAKKDFNLYALITYIKEYIKENGESDDKKITELSLCYEFLQNAINNEKKAVNQEILITSNLWSFDYKHKNFKLIIRVLLSTENDIIPFSLLGKLKIEHIV